jgi:hypothetical protein
MTKKKVATKAAVDPRDGIISDLRSKIAVLIDRLVHLEQNEKAACALPRPDFSAGTVVNARTLVVDNCGRAWWINPDTLDIRLA